MTELAIELAKQVGIWQRARQELEDQAYDEWSGAEPREPDETWLPDKDDEVAEAEWHRLNRLAGGSGPFNRAATMADHDEWEKDHARWEQAHSEWEDSEPGEVTDAAVLAHLLRGLRRASPTAVEYVNSHALAHALETLARTGSSPAETSAVTRRLCACGCGRPVTSPRPEAKYATGACRVRAHRAS